MKRIKLSSYNIGIFSFKTIFYIAFTLPFVYPIWEYKDQLPLIIRILNYIIAIFLVYVIYFTTFMGEFEEKK
jgi:hypothetical protein